ncbi:helix-turn-helix domain-containing protein [Streptomyces subrutilus]|uniref:helix-turn-helix domain-containing protein n=1 Tax=Streptomyces subrutilus TaxID=36818 RepID=UPI002E0D9328|nr:PucR family transcriptional regulator [Streptomyces subrutilus]
MEATPPRTPPPTPPVPLSALLRDRELGLRLLAGPAEADVHGVHASEMADPSPYLLGGELLLTAGAEPADAGQYVAGLAGAGVAALGFGVAPVHERVPPGLADACERAGLPLLEVPPGTPFSAVARTVWRLMAEARTRELRRVTEAQRSLAAAAARPDPVPAVLRRLAATLGGRVELAPDGASAGGAPPAPAAEALAALLDRVGRPGGPATATAEADGWHLAAHALNRRPSPPGGEPDRATEPAPGGDGPARALGTATPSRAPGDHTIASVAAVLLTLLTAHRPGGDEGAALTRLLLDGDPDGALGPGPWYAVHARGAGDPQALAGALGTVLLDPRADGVRLLTDRDPDPQPGWRLGVGAPAAPARLRSAAAQALRALERAEAARMPLARHAPGGLGALLDPAEARAYAEALLAPLGRAHADTLRAWLAHHGSWDRSAAALGVHRNTVRQRIARCAALLALDLDDPDTRMELWFALRHTEPEGPPGGGP